MKDQFELDPEEQRIEDEADQYRPITGKERERLDRKLQGDQETTMVSIRLSGADLSAIREKAERQGVPYQTLIKSILHQYATDQVWLLADKEPGYLDDRIYSVAKRVYQEMSEG